MKFCFGKMSLAMLLTLGLLTGYAAAATYIQVTSTPDSTSMGYTYGQDYQFTWVISDANTTNSPSNYFASTVNIWRDFSISDLSVFSDIYGDELSGSFVRPTVSSSDPQFSLETYPDNETRDWLTLSSGNAGDYGIGLTVNGIAVKRMTLTAYLPDGLFSFPESYTAPSEYFDNLAGNYDVVSSSRMSVTDNDSNALWFTVSSVEIVPEPATMGLLGFGGVMILLRKRRK